MGGNIHCVTIPNIETVKYVGLYNKMTNEVFIDIDTIPKHDLFYLGLYPRASTFVAN